MVLTAVALLLGAAPEATAQRPASACASGQLRCVDAVIREMQRRFAPLARSCDHDAVFALAYLRTTETYRRTVAADPAFFRDTRWVNRLDVRFADAYFAAYDGWHARRRREVPRAWAIAFDAADRRAVSGAGNLLLGMNAHIQRDLPVELAELGLTTREGESRKPDHDKVNEILKEVYRPLVEELRRRFDPTIPGPFVPGDLAEDPAFQLVVAWREQAWRHAELIAAARTAVQREAAVQLVERYAASQAELIRGFTAYPPGQDSAARDAWCATHGEG
jgi:hypothetical protein